MKPTEALLSLISAGTGPLEIKLSRYLPSAASL